MKTRKPSPLLPPVGPLQQVKKPEKKPASLTLAVIAAPEGKKVVLLQVDLEDVMQCRRLIEAAQNGTPADKVALRKALPLLQSIVKGWLLS
ncbi:MAG: hypothetical protein ACTHLW_05975 [Verrucomicrobiota bacterium]